MSEYCVELNNISKKFGKFVAVDNVSLKLEKGKVYGFIGPNGAGKTTTMSMIMGTLFPTSGSGNVMGHQLASKEAIANLGYSPEFTSFYTDMSCLEYLWYMGTLSGMSSNEAFERAKALINQFELNAHAGKKVAKFSTGMKKKVSLAQAMIHNPQILLLDEPTANLDPTSRYEILETVKKMAREYNLTVLISSHVLTELETVADHVIMIEHGRIIMDAEIKKAEEMFKQGLFDVDCSNNDLLLELLNNKYAYEMAEGNIRFSAEDAKQLKNDIIKIVYENQLELNLFKEEKISLDLLYQEVLRKEQANEKNN